jgi:hypothetical protein
VLDYIDQRFRQNALSSEIQPLSPEAANGSRRRQFIEILAG